MIPRRSVTKLASFAPALLSAVVVLAATLSPSPAAAGKRSRAVQRTWVSPDFASSQLRKIAILPAATFDGNHDATRATSAMWLNAALGTGYQWVPAQRVRLALAGASSRADSLIEAVNDQIRGTGRVDPVTARTIGRLTDTDGVLCLRVDKWVTTNSPSSRETASITISAVLVDTEGRELWKVSGSAIHEGGVVPRAFTDATPREAAPTAGLTSGGSSSSSSGSGEGSSEAGGSASSSGGSGGSGSASGGSSGSSGSSASGASSSGTSPAQMPSSRPDPAASLALQRELYVADVAAVYQGALSDLYSEWLPLLPAPSGSKGAPAKKDSTAR